MCSSRTNPVLTLGKVEIVPERLGVRKTKTKFKGKCDAKLKFPEGGGGRVQIKMSSVWKLGYAYLYYFWSNQTN